jgi:hypothetical protein
MIRWAEKTAVIRLQPHAPGPVLIKGHLRAWD